MESGKQYLKTAWHKKYNPIFWEKEKKKQIAE